MTARAIKDFFLMMPMKTCARHRMLRVISELHADVTNCSICDMERRHSAGWSPRLQAAAAECGRDRPAESRRSKKKAQAGSPVPQLKRKVGLLLRPLLPPLGALRLNGFELRLLIRGENREDLRFLSCPQLFELRLLRLDGRLQRVQLGRV